MKRDLFRKITILLFIFLLFPTFLNSADITTQKIEVRGNKIYFGDACLEERKGLTIVHLKGSPYEIGFQHGTLLKEKIKRGLILEEEELCKQVEENLGKPIPRLVLHYLLLLVYQLEVKKFEEFIPKEFLEEMRGIADASGTDFAIIMLLNSGYDMLENLYSFYCTCFAATPKASSDGNLYHARNLDWSETKMINETDTVFIISPEKGYSFVTVAPACFVGVVSGMNTKNIAVTINASMSLESTFKGIPTFLLLRKLIQYSNDLKSACEVLENSPRAVGNNILVSDGKIKESLIFEGTAKNFAYRYPENGIVYGTNHFVDKKMAKLQGPYSQEWNNNTSGRFDRVAELLKQNSGKIKADICIDILRDRYNWEGKNIDSYCPQSLDSPKNAQSIIFCPNNLNFWVANGKPAPACDGEYIGLNLASELSQKNSKVSDYPKNAYLKTEGYLSFQHYKKGNEFLEEEKLQEADIEYQKALTLEKSSATLYRLLGYRYGQVMKNYDLAIEYLNKSLQLAKKSETKYFPYAYTYYFLGKFQILNGQIKEGISSLQKVFDYSPDTDRKIWSLIRIGQGYDILLEREKAVAVYKEALSLQTKDSEAKIEIKKYLKKSFILGVDEFKERKGSWLLGEI